MEQFIVATVVGENGPLMRGCELQLGGIGAAQILRVPCGEDIEPMRTQKLREKDRYIFIEIEPDEERRSRHWRRG